MKVLYEELDGKVQPCVALMLGKKGHYTMKIVEETGVTKTEEMDNHTLSLRDTQSMDAFSTNAAMVSINEDDLSFVDNLMKEIGSEEGGASACEEDDMDVDDKAASGLGN